MYEGNFVDGDRSGEGTMYWSNHTYSKGTWKKGEIVQTADTGTWR